MVAGSIAGAARLLNIAQPGVGRTMKHLETSLGIRLFTRKGGRHVPAPEARHDARPRHRQEPLAGRVLVLDAGVRGRPEFRVAF